MDDVNNWKEIIKFPVIESFNWEEQSRISKDYLNNTKLPNIATILNGYYERLISFMEFENAAIAMVDEDQEDALHELFDALTDLYCRLIDKYVQYFNLQGVQIHDDWGSQRAPFFSIETIRKMLVPHMKQFVDHVHSKGLFVELHSCGKNDMIAEAIVECGFDTWTPQAMNDVSELYKKYGKEIVLGVSLPAVASDSTAEEITKAAQSFVDEYVHKDAPVLIGFYSEMDDRLLQEVYRLSRIRLSQ